MDIKAQSLFAEMQSMATQARSAIAPTQGQDFNPMVENTSKADFGEMLGQAIKGVSDMGWEAKDMTTKFQLEDPNISLADVMVAKEKAGIAFEATVQVRNKLLEAYRQIMNMPV